VRAVFDSNVWISAMKFQGIPLRALDAAFLSQTIVCCREIRVEVERFVSIKFGMSTHEAAEVMDDYLEFGIEVTITGNLRNVCRDHKDDVIVECAVIGDAHLIVSGDKDLLSLHSYEGIEIVSPARFLELLQPAN
jgi:putative PIN family toxin of toxin-antitoxin system